MYTFKTASTLPKLHRNRKKIFVLPSGALAGLLWFRHRSLGPGPPAHASFLGPLPKLVGESSLSTVLGGPPQVNGRRLLLTRLASRAQHTSIQHCEITL
jgi:hypothetical protein